MATRLLPVVLLGALLLMAAPVSGASPGGDSSPLTLRVDPSEIRMDTFYSGALCQVSGDVSDGSSLVLVVKGSLAKEELQKKRRAGPIWINGGKVFVSGAPRLFLRFSSTPVEGILGREALEQYQLDERAIAGRLVVEPTGPDDRIISENYFKLKKQQSVYVITESTVRVTRNPGGRATFSLEFPWPKKAPPGLYDVHAFECGEGRVLNVDSKQIRVVETGFPAWLARLATEKASLYGAFAVLVALLGGFGIDFLASLLGKRQVTGH